jgi:hypothetical protein
VVTAPEEGDGGGRERRVEVRLPARAVSAAMLAATAAVLAADLATAPLRGGPGDASARAVAGAVFALDREGNVPSLFASLGLLLAAGLLGLRALVAARVERGRWAASWALLAAGFGLLAFDEAAQLHETLGRLLPAALRPRGFAAAWVLPASALVAGLALAYLPFVRALPPRCRRGFLGAGLLYLAGALGLETAGGLLVACHHPGCAGFDSAAYAAAAFAEEACELLGVAWFVRALLDHLGGLGVEVSLRVAAAPGGTARPRTRPPPRRAPGRPG